MTEFADRMFAAIHNLPPTEPEHADVHGPDSPESPMQKFHEQVLLDHAMGHKSAPAENFSLEELLTKSRDYRDAVKITPQFKAANTLEELAENFAKRFGQPIQPAPGGDLFGKRFTPHADEDDQRRIVTKYSSGNVVAELDENGVVTKTYFEPAA